MLGVLLALAWLSSKPMSSSTPSPTSSWVVRFQAGTTVGEITLLPVPRWVVRRGSSIVAQGTGATFEDCVRPMLEAFAAATIDQPAQGIFIETDRTVTVSVFQVAGVVRSWGWTITDGATAVNGFAGTRGVAILDALERAARGPG